MSAPGLLVLAWLAVCLACHALTALLLPALAPKLKAARLAGSDLLKPARPILPEALGLIPGALYILALSLFLPLPYLHLLSTNLPEHLSPFPHDSLAASLASILSLLSALFLGFLDDVFDIRWRFKLPIPIIASVPLLTTYAASNASTQIVIPHIFHLRLLFGVVNSNGLLSIGPWYYLYMSLLSTFCTNSINILAGINGVEVGQSVIICLSIIINDLLYIPFDLSFLGFNLHLAFGLDRGSKLLQDRHLFSLFLMMPLLAVMLALLKFNWYPAKGFVGDTFCYFAGMAFAVVGILGHFSKTLLLFFIPQIFNFLYSCPQLFGLVPIPRHRLPTRDPHSGLLMPSMVTFVNPPKSYRCLSWLNSFKLVRLQFNRQGTITGCSNLTLLNLILIWFGDMKEEHLTISVLCIQALGSLLAFGIRYGLTGWFYDTALRR